MTGRPVCPTCNDERLVERLATPEEVDAGCELGIAYDPCPDCTRATSRPTSEIVTDLTTKLPTGMLLGEAAQRLEELDANNRALRDPKGGTFT